MDTGYLNRCVNDIRVQNMINEDVIVENKSPLAMIGKGRQGAVFQVTDSICVKVFGNEEDCEREYYALSLGQHTKLFPKVYAKGPLHIAMEIIRGVDLREYLQSQPLTRELSTKLINLLLTFKEIGYERIDHHKRQIYLQEDGSLKVIDVARTVWRDRVYPYPRKLLNSLGEENKEVFLAHVQTMAPRLYEEWKHYIRMEEISRQIYQVLMNQQKAATSSTTLSDKLLTTNDEQKYVVLLEGLVHKVLKEEWVRTMLARGYKPDLIMEKIDEYWDYREQGNSSQNGVPKEIVHNRERERNNKKNTKIAYWDKGREQKKDRRLEKNKKDKKDKKREKEKRKKPDKKD